ncbi:DUF3088 domain-containing protein [Aureimonas altamirensis]|uniref:DUF3088 domain-containing protein n=1 Tax=Aureimonas altamirensis TaxID=370622 RepID=UPI0020374711|nr:DUF3088 domain-containing protein [Aureimonas altamirensis]MCM2505615.1 DUF3088 domain-containing protein [Aureimonas altamirensis]
MKRDTLVILKPDFIDPAFPGMWFYCWHCALMEGVIASFPKLTEKIDVLRVKWPRPRNEVVELIGAENQSLPVLIFAEGASDSLATGSFKGRLFAEGKDMILAALSERHGIPFPHP